MHEGQRAEQEGQQVVHHWTVRLWHWANVAAMAVMVPSGWRIYNAAPIWSGWVFPKTYTLGGWLGGALQWHFAGMWVFGAGLVLHAIVSVARGHIWRRLLPVEAGALVQELRLALMGRLGHADQAHYNQPQRLAYLSALLGLFALLASGLVLWKSVQFPVLRELLGGYEGARRVHFLAMCLVLGFVALHLLMVVLVPRTLLAMLRGH